MPKITQENKKYYKSKIRSVLAMDYSQSSRELQETLEANGIRLDRHYIDKLRKEIDKESILEIDRTSATRVLSAVARTLRETRRINFNIANNPQSKRSERTAASRELRKIEIDMANILLEFGIFNRSLGSIEHVIRNAPLSEEKKTAIREAFEKWGLIVPEEENHDADGDTPNDNGKR